MKIELTAIEREQLSKLLVSAISDHQWAREGQLHDAQEVEWRKLPEWEQLQSAHEKRARYHEWSAKHFTRLKDKLQD